MKKNLLSALCGILFVAFATAQVPQGVNYQAVARNNAGAVLQNQPVSVRLTVHDVTAAGTVVYQETHNVTTNQFGIFAVVIGGGTLVQGTFTGINWGTGAKYLQVELDATGGTTYVDMGTSQLQSVPYALYAANSPTGATGATGPTGATGLAGATGADGGTLDKAYDFGGAGAGRIIIADSGAVEINGTDGFVSTGTLGTGTIPATGGGARMMWYPAKAAFRAGYILGNNWDDDSTGINSVATGYATTASGNYSTAMGYGAVARGEQSFAVGYSTASGFASSAIGYGNMASGQGTVAIGLSNNASGDYASAIGQANTATGLNSVAIGGGNTASGASAVAAGGGSIASGHYSFAVGFLNRASQYYSVAMGANCLAQGQSSIAMGAGCVAYNTTSIALGDASTSLGAYASALGASDSANGYISTAIGYLSRANGDYSMALGNRSVSRGNSSITLGNNTEASGYSGMALGVNTFSRSYGETALGIFNTDYSPVNETYAVAGDRLLVVGNGTGVGLRSDALVILKNGNIGVGTSVPVAKLDVAGQVKITDGTEGTGKVLISDVSGLASWKNAPGVHYVGESYGGGMVFWVDSTGTHGLITALDDIGSGSIYTWYNGTYVTTNAVCNGVNAGMRNTERMQVTMGSGSYAADLCANYQGGGYGDWYLPSKDELNKLQLTLGTAGLANISLYARWSSTESNLNYAWDQYVGPNGGLQETKFKIFQLKVRPVRAF